MQNLNSKIAILSTIQQKNLDKLSELGSLVFVDMVRDAIEDGNTELKVDIGLGIVTVNFEGEKLRFRFSPSAKLKERIASIKNTDKSEIETLLEKSLKEKIENTYKDLF